MALSPRTLSIRRGEHNIARKRRRKRINGAQTRWEQKTAGYIRAKAAEAARIRREKEAGKQLAVDKVEKDATKRGSNRKEKS